MASCPSSPAAQSRRRSPAQKTKVGAIAKATRHSDRMQAVVREGARSQPESEARDQQLEKQETFSSLQQVQETVDKSKKRVLDLDNSSNEEPKQKRLQSGDAPLMNLRGTVTTENKPREDEALASCVSHEPASEEIPIVWKTIGDARIDYWRTTGNWPSVEQEVKMSRVAELIRPPLPVKKPSFSLRRKRSEASINAETVPSGTASDQISREKKSAPYRDARYERQLAERRSFMGKYKDISVESKKLCERLLVLSQSPKRSPPKDTLFEEEFFERTLELIKGRNETRVIRDIAQLIVPSAEILAIRGSKHLEILRETTNSSWKNAIPFWGPFPQPDYSLGFKREAFTKEQLDKLDPWIGNSLYDASYFAVTDDMYFPFLTSEVKCGATALDIADRQNAHSQSVLLTSIYELFRSVGRQDELHNTINGFSYSHSDVDVRIWAHLIVINGDKIEFYREPIAKFDIEKTAQADNRWVGWTVAMNILDTWAPDHFKLICSAVDLLPDKLNFEVSELSEFRSFGPDVPSRSGISGQADDHSMVDADTDDDGTDAEHQQIRQQVTPATTIEPNSGNNKKKKTR